MHWFQNHGREEGGSQAAASKLLRLNKRASPTKRPAWRVFQLENHNNQVKSKANETFEEETRKYKIQMARATPEEATLVKKPEWISTLNRVAQELYADSRDREQTDTGRIPEKAASDRVQEASGNSEQASLVE